jgi:hypothetical protein
MGEMLVIAMAVVAIVLIIGMSINSIVEKVMADKRLRREAGQPQGSGEIKAITDRQHQIEERLRVLERIATDRGSLLADEIEALRASTRELAAPAVRATEEVNP